MSAATSVWCVGVATLDTIAVVDRLPGHDERAVAERFAVAGGGPAATAAVALARLGVAAGFVGVVGDDDAGRQVREGLEAEGVDVSRLRTDPAAETARAIVLVEAEGGARTIIASPQPRPAADDVPADAAWLHVDHAGYAAARAAGGGARLSIDDGNAVGMLDLAGVDLYAPTEQILLGRFGGGTDAALRASAAAGARRVVATRGARGSVVLDGDVVVEVPGFAVDAVSTLGAGDVFHGALLAAVVDGKDTVEAARFASVVAALSCRALDGRSAIPSWAEAAAELAQPRADASEVTR